MRLINRQGIISKKGSAGRRTGISIVLSCSMIFSLFGAGGESGTVSAAGSMMGSGESNVLKMGQDEKALSGAGSSISMAESYTDEATNFTYTVSGEDAAAVAAITGYAGEETELTIPSEVVYNGKKIKVVEIGDEAFREDSEITAVTISEGIEAIGQRSFYGCENLAKVSVPASIKKWGWRTTDPEGRAFAACTNLTSLTLAEGLTVLGDEAFSGCSALGTVSIPSTIQEFPDQVFKDCISLTELELPEGIRQIGYRAFEGCTSIQEVVIPSTIERWNTCTDPGSMQELHDCCAFKDCTSLNKVTFSEGLKSLGNSQLFPGCTSLKSVTVPSTVRNLNYAFYGCTYLEEITLEEGIEVINNSAFWKCSSLKKMILPHSIKEIYGNSFFYCTNLETLVIPENVESLINGSPVMECPALKEVWFLGDNIPYYTRFRDANSDTDFYCIPGSRTWDVLKEALEKTGEESHLKEIPSVEGISVQPYKGEYDGEKHPLFSVSGTQEGDFVTYRQIAEDGTRGALLSEIPEASSAGDYQTDVIVHRYKKDGTPKEKYKISGIRAAAVIQKKTPVIKLEDMNFYYQADWTVDPVEYEGEAELSYRYYKDKGCRREIEGKPAEPGTYYIVAETEETDNYLAGRSEPVKLVLAKTESEEPTPESSLKPTDTPSSAPDENATQNPDGSATQNPDGSVTQNPDESVTQNPDGSATQNPDGSATQNPDGSATQNPDGSATQNPDGSATQNPDGSATQNPDGSAAQNPDGNTTPPPSGDPAGNTSPSPSGQPGENVSPSPSGQPDVPAVPEKGTEIKAKDGASYTVSVSDSKKGAVAYRSPKNTNATSVKVPASVTINGVTYKVTSVAANAFKNCKKLKKVTIGNNITTIGKSAFVGCTKLKSLILGKNVSAIGDSAFNGCASLTKVTIPSKVKKIGKQAFKGCKKLKTVVLKTEKLTAKTVGAKAFSGLAKKVTVKAPKKVKKAYQKLFKAKGAEKAVVK